MHSWEDTLSAKTKSRYHSLAKQFVRWCKRKRIVYWSELTLELLELYRKHCLDKYEGWTPHHYTRIIKQVSLWASRVFRGQFDHFAEGFKVPRPVVNRLQDEDALSLVEVGEFCLFLRDEPDGWKILPAVALCGLCGLGVEEARRLKWDYVDLEAGTVTITGERKNTYRERRIPVPKLVHILLHQAPREGERVVHTYRDYTAFGNAYKRFFTRWGKDRSYVVPSNLRDVVQTHAEIEGFDGYVLSRYVGHAADSIRRQHYTKRSQATLLQDMRSQVTDKVDDVLVNLSTICQRFDNEANVVQLPSGREV